MILFFSLWGGIIFLGNVQGQELTASPKASSLPTPVPTPAYVPTAPVIISIPKISLSAYVEPVGVDLAGKMEVPKKDEDVGWYNLGFKPGEMGSAVIDGHLDKVTGAPAIFWNLSKLSVGDEIFVTDQNNKTLKFKVYDKELYSYNDAPIDKIFNSNGQATLNLITCGGTFNQAARNYSSRTIVFSKQELF